MRISIDISRKGFTINRQPGQELTGLIHRMPRTSFNYKAEVDGYQSAIIMACIRWLQRTYPEAPLMLEKQDGESWERIWEHPLLSLMDNPNPFYDGLQLMLGVLADYVLTGNAYIIKVRSNAGRPVQLWWMPSMMVEPKWPNDNSKFLTHYEYYTGGQGYVTLMPEDVVHWRDGFDPSNIRKGMSPLKSLFREVFTDDEAANMTAVLMKNLGVPGLVLSPDEGVTISKEDAQETKDWIKDNFGGDKRGEPLVMSSSTKVAMFGFNPKDMTLRELRKIPEERITAVIGVPAIVAGLGAGLDRSTYANYAEAREAAYEGTILPMQRLFGSTAKKQFLTDYEDDVLKWRVKYDLTDVRIFQDDDNRKTERINKMISGGYMKVTQAQEMSGLPVDESQDYYLRPFNVVAVTSGPSPESEQTPSDEGSSKSARSFLDEFGKEARWNEYAMKAESAENKLRAGLGKMFSAQSKEVVKNIKAGERENLFNSPNARKAYSDLAMPILSELMAKEIEDSRNMLNGHKSLKQFEEGILSPEALTWMKTRIGWAAEQVTEETAHLLQMQLAEGFGKGESIQELTLRVKETFNFCDKTRSQRIARTETIQAAAQGAIEGYKEAGVGRLEFYPSPDACEDCLALAGEYPLDQTPGMITVHPNCRCTWLPVV